MITKDVFFFQKWSIYMLQLGKLICWIYFPLLTSNYQQSYDSLNAIYFCRKIFFILNFYLELQIWTLFDLKKKKFKSEYVIISGKITRFPNRQPFSFWSSKACDANKGTEKIVYIYLLIKYQVFSKTINAM